MTVAAAARLLGVGRSAVYKMLAAGRKVVDRLHLRVYADAGWEDRWAEMFSGKKSDLPPEAPDLAAQLVALGIRRKEFGENGSSLPEPASRLVVEREHGEG